MPDLRCSFCSRYQYDVECLVSGDGVYICSYCVDLAVQVVERKRRSNAATRVVVGPRRDLRGALPNDIRGVTRRAVKELIG